MSKFTIGFNDKSDPQLEPFGVYPSRDFEEQTGISGLSARYVFPEGKSGYELRKDAEKEGLFDERDISSERLTRLQETWSSLAQLNPALSDVAFGTEDASLLAVAIRNTGRQLNVDDINCALELARNGHSFRSQWQDQAFVERIKKMDSLFASAGDSDISVEWSVALKTLDRMHDLLAEKAPVWTQKSRRPPPEETYPSKEFEEAIGIRGIAEDYAFPRGMTGFEFQRIFLTGMSVLDLYEDCSAPEYKIKRISDAPPDMMTRLHAEWDSLVSLNPVLEKVMLDKDEPLQFHDAIAGVVSLFNVDDINYFLKNCRDTGSMKVPKSFGTPAFDSIVVEINRFLPPDDDTPISWVCSLKTLEKIRDRLAEKQRHMPPGNCPGI